ncbi:MAG: hypothetical protein WD055_03955 [Candidatus Dependentiae bacterium]
MYHQNLRMTPSKHIDIAHIARVNHAAFLEHEIIAFNEMLLSPGLHTVTVKNKKVGREIVDIFLSLLNCYQRVYWLSSDRKVPPGTINLYEQFNTLNCLDDNAQLYEFMCTQFNANFLVIESSDMLQYESWFEQFHIALHEIHAFDNIPVLHLDFMQ